MNKIDVFRAKKSVRIFFFLLIFGLFFHMVGCGTWKKTWKTPWSRSDSHLRYGKELPEAPLYTGHSQDELVDQAAVLRHTSSSTAPTAETVRKEEKKPWHQRLLMSSKASEIDTHLGE